MAAVVIILGTFNLRVPCDPPPNDWASRVSRVREVIKSSGLEIFGVQEAVPQQLEDIVKGTSYASFGVGRDDFGPDGEHSSIIYDTKRFELVEGGTFALSETPDVAGSKSWGTCCPRIATWGKFKDKKNDKIFCFYNTHLDHVSEEARVEGIKLIVSHAKTNCTDMPLVLTGDFNAEPDSRTIAIAEELLNDAGKIAQEKSSAELKCTFQAFGKSDYNIIDYIFVSDDIKVKSFKVDTTKPGGFFASDHYPVIAELIL